MDRRIIRAASAAIVLGFSAAIASAGPYAGTISEAGGNVSFRLGEAADEVIVIRDGVSQSLGGLGVGQHSFPRSGAVNYSIVVRKSSADGYQTITLPSGDPNFPANVGILQTSDDLNTRNNFDRGTAVAINRNPATPSLFGRIYISAPRIATTFNGRNVSDGIYINGPDGSDILSQGDTAFTAGIPFDTDLLAGAASPWRMTLDNDGNVYMGDWSDSVGTVWRAGPDVGQSGGINLLSGTGGPAPAMPTASNNHGSIAGLAVSGSTTTGNLVVYTIDEDLDPDAAGPPTSPWQLNSLWRYNIGAGPVPTNQIPDLLANQILISDFTPGGVICDLHRAPDGKFFMTQNRNDGNEVGLAVIASDGTTVVFNSLAESNARNIDGNLGLDGIQDALRLVRNVAVSPDGRYAALATGSSGDVIILPLLAGVPDLPNRLLLDSFGAGQSDGISFDAAGNITVVNRTEELLRTFSPGGLSLTVFNSNGSFSMDPSYTAGAGNYSTAGSWLAGVVPNGANHVARFAGSGGNVNMDVATTLGAIKFDSASSYTLSGTNTITLQGTSPSVIAQQGNHTVSAPLLLTQSSGFVANGGALTVSNLNYGTTPTYPIEVYTGGSGVVSLNRVTAQALYVVEGTTRIIPNGTAAATSNVKQLRIAGGATPIAKLDITNNAFVVDYTPPAVEAEPLDTIKAQIISAYAGGNWTGNGITSLNANANSHGIGYSEASALASIPAIFGTVDGSAVLFRLTRYGDANLDGTVNLADFNRLAGNFGSTGADWSQGDFNYDSLVNLADFNRLAGNFGLSATGRDAPTAEDWATLAAAVPEPASLSLVAVGALTLLRRRRR